MRERLGALILCILLILWVCSAASWQGSKPKPGPKPKPSATAKKAPNKPASKPAAVSSAKPAQKDPAEILYAHAQATLKFALDEFSRLRQEAERDIAGKFSLETGEKPVGLVDLGAWYSQYTNPTIETQKQLEARWSDFKAGRTTRDGFILQAYGSLFEFGGSHGAISNVWRLAQLDSEHRMAVVRYVVEKPTGSVLALKLAADQGSLGAVQGQAQKVFGEIALQVRAINERLVEARKRLVPRMWEAIDLASKLSAKPDDVHDRYAKEMKQLLSGAFKNLPFSTLSFRYWRVPFNDPTPRAYPDVQIDPYYANVVAVGKIDDIPVERLKEFAVVSTEWEVADVRVVPASADAQGRVLPETVEDSDSYLLFAYGARLPAKREELKSVTSSEPGILYEVLAYQSEADTPNLSPELRRKWELGKSMMLSGLEGVELEDARSMVGLLLRVKLVPGVMPGVIKFKINSADAQWFLDFGSGHAEVSIVRGSNKLTSLNALLKEAEDPYEKSSLYYLGERVYVQVKTAGPVRTNEIPVILGRNGRFLEVEGESTLTASNRKTGDPTVFISAPIELVARGDPRIDPENTEAKREAGVVYLPCERQDTLFAQVADPRAFKVREPVFSTRIEELWATPWHEALRRASEADGKNFSSIVDWNAVSDTSILEVKNTILTQVVFKFLALNPLNRAQMKFLELLYGARLEKGEMVVRNRITLGNHAAMLLLRDHFLVLMTQSQLQLQGHDSPAKQIAFIQSLEPLISSGQHPLSSLLVEGPRPLLPNPEDPNSGLYPLSTMFPRGRRQSDEEKEWLRKGCLSAFAYQRAMMRKSIQKAEELADRDIQGLLELTGQGFKAVADDLIPTLMRYERGADGVTRIVPDRVGRAEVRTINTAFEAVRAQKEYSSADTEVAVTAASLTPILASAGVLKTASSVALSAFSVYDTLANQIPEFIRRQEEYEFASGATSVLGTERFCMADAQRTSVYALVINCIAAGVGVKESVPGLMAGLSKLRALPEAAAQAKEILAAGAKALWNAPANAQAAFFSAAAAAESKLTRYGQLALSNLEKRIVEAKKAIDAASKEARRVARKVKLPELRAAAANKAAVADLRPMPTDFPVAGRIWEALNGKQFDIAKLISDSTAFFKVYLVNGGKEVLKVCKDVGPDALRQFRDIKHAMKTLGNRFPVLKITRMHVAEEGAYLVQEFLPTNFAKGKESFFLDQFVKKFGFPAEKGADRALNTLKSEVEDAVIELMAKLRDAGIAWEDCKPDNMFVRRILTGPNAGKLEAGISDIDRIARWGDFTPDMVYFTSKMESVDAIAKEGRFLKSLKGSLSAEPDLRMKLMKKANPGLDPFENLSQNRLMPDLETFWETTFERKGWLHFADNGGFRSRILDLEKLSRRFKRLPNRVVIDLNQLSPVVPPRPGVLPELPPIPPRPAIA